MANPSTLEECDIVNLGESAIAEQPYAVGINSDYKHLAARMFDALIDDRSQFENKGFKWQLANE